MSTGEQLVDPVRVYVGTDRSQLLAVKVLEHSIRRHTKLPVEVHPMLDLPIPKPRDPRQQQRTGFSFSRFCIPELAGYKGRAIYMDADMLVFSDIEELWNMPFDGAKIVIQEELNEFQSAGRKLGSPKKRIKQCAVMLLDCETLSWNIKDIVESLDRGDVTYESLMYDMCVLKESEIKYGIPFRWNSLEHFEEGTSLIHFTDMSTQPWVSTNNPWGFTWFDEVRLMLKNDTLKKNEIKSEIDLGYFRPSLLRDIYFRHLIPKVLLSHFDRLNFLLDRLAGFKPHKAVYAAVRERERVIRDFEAAQSC